MAESCAIANESIMSVQTDISEAFTGLSDGDFTGAVDALTLIETQLGSALEQITNPEVSAAVGDLHTTFGTLTQQISGAAQNGAESVDQAALQATATDLQTQSQVVQGLCS